MYHYVRKHICTALPYMEIRPATGTGQSEVVTIIAPFWLRAVLSSLRSRQSMEPKALLPCFQEHSNKPYPEPDKSNPYCPNAISPRTILILKNGVIWDVTPCGSCKNRHFGGTWRLHHQSDKNWWARNVAVTSSVRQLLVTATFLVHRLLALWWWRS
jgi:hypothetical protein